MIRLTKDQIIEVCIRYQSGESSELLGMAYGISGRAIRGLLQRRGIERRSKAEAARSYTCNHAFFSVIASEAQAYWLGFIAADGYISDRGALVIQLARKDEGHLEFLRDAMGSTHPIRRYKYPYGHDASRLYIASSELCQDLSQYGVVSNKTMTHRWLNLEFDLLRHFLRGYVDGDGGFYLRQKGYPTPASEFSITSNKPFLAECQKFLVEHCDLAYTKFDRRHPEGVEIVTMRYVGTTQVRRIAEFLYNNATIYLQRKREVILGS